MATKQPAVVIPVRLDKKGAERDAKSLTAALKGALAPVALAGAAAGAALVGFAAAMLKAAKAASIQEQAELKLIGAVRTRAEFTRQEFEALQKSNSAIQQATAIGDERLLQLQSELTLMSVRKDQLTEATKATIGLAESTGNELVVQAARRQRETLCTADINELGRLDDLAQTGLQIDRPKQTIRNWGTYFRHTNHCY